MAYNISELSKEELLQLLEQMSVELNRLNEQLDNINGEG